MITKKPRSWDSIGVKPHFLITLSPFAFQASEDRSEENMVSEPSGISGRGSGESRCEAQGTCEGEGLHQEARHYVHLIQYMTNQIGNPGL